MLTLNKLFSDWEYGEFNGEPMTVLQNTQINVFGM